MDIPSEVAIFVSGLATLTLAAVFAVMAYHYYKILSKYFGLKSERELKEIKEGEIEKLRKQTEAAYEETLGQVRQIISQSSDRAQKIISEAESVPESVKKEVSLAISSAAQRQADQIVKSVSKYDLELQSVLQKLASDINITASGQLNNFKVSLDQTAGQFSNSMKKLYEEEKKRAENELSLYKKERMEKINEVVFGIIQEVSRDVLGKVLTKEEQEELVVKALEEAKRKRII